MIIQIRGTTSVSHSLTNCVLIEYKHTLNVVTDVTGIIYKTSLLMLFGIQLAGCIRLSHFHRLAPTADSLKKRIDGLLIPGHHLYS